MTNNARPRNTVGAAIALLKERGPEIIAKLVEMARAGDQASRRLCDQHGIAWRTDGPDDAKA
jgi:hypothetical protein